MNLSDVIISDNLIVAILSAPRNKEGFNRVEIRPLELRGSIKYQVTSYTATQVFHKNIESEAVISYIESQMIEQFKNGIIYAQDGDYNLFCNRLHDIKVEKRAPSKKMTSQLSHNRQKKHILPADTFIPFLYELGIINSDGKIKNDKVSKFKQINRFLEFIADLLPHLGEGPLRIIDFGCGKSYLTFAVHYYFKTILNRDVKIIGIDQREDVIATCQKVVIKYQLEGIEFIRGDIRDFENSQPVDLVVSLHACDTATDYALFQAITWQARFILAVPCCHHELNSHFQSQKAVYRTYGLLQERLATLMTDLTRSILLEVFGYRVQILEFIAMEHTPKNVLIRAIKVQNNDVDCAKKRLQEIHLDYPFILTLEQLLNEKYGKKAS